jgi:hypothetical protein
MAQRSLRDLIRQVLSGGLAVGGAAQPLPAMPAPTHPSLPAEPRTEVTPSAVPGRDLVIRASRPKVLLRALDATRTALISSHRSHRSHSSHYSSRGGGTTTPPVTTPPTPVTKDPRPRDSAGTGRVSPQPQSVISAPVDTAALGSRVLRRGMSGKDVDQLIMLLVKGKLLTASEIPQTSLFTETVERAVKQFQSSKGIPADGVVDYRTLLLLRVQ